ncbi:MAG: UDP-N-acetylmuramate dehydrogenase [Patescibacteria group bacterium]
MIKTNVPLSDYSNYHIGGPARYFFEVKNLSDLRAGLVEWDKIRPTLAKGADKIFILGGGTNLVIDDRGFGGLVIRTDFNFIEHDDFAITFGSGAPMSEAVNFCTEAGLAGFAWAGGLPGSVGGAVRGNAGAFGGEIKDNLREVASFNLKTRQSRRFSAAECRFGYRTSYFKTQAGQDEVIVLAVFDFEAGDRSKIAQEVREREGYRQSHQPLEYPSAGSTFKNIDVRQAPAELIEAYRQSIKNDPFPVIPVARLLSDAGLRGKQIGAAMFSEKHPNFIVNLGGATAKDVLALIDLARKTIGKRFGVDLELEIMYLPY